MPVVALVPSLHSITKSEKFPSITGCVTSAAVPILSKFSTETFKHSTDDEVRKLLKTLPVCSIFANIINLLTVNNRYLKGHHID